MAPVETMARPAAGRELGAAADLTPIAARLRNKPFAPLWGLKGAHQQTILGFFWPRRFLAAHVPVERILFRLSDGSQVLAECRWQKAPAAHPTYLGLHGMEGSSQSGYMLGTADKAYHHGFNAIRLNLRNCGDTEHLTRTLYHSGQSDDMREVVEALIRHHGLRRIVLAGFSLGGNICLKLVAEWGEAAPREVIAAGVISPLVDVTASWPLLELPGNWIYRRRFVRDLKGRLRRKARLFPEIYSPAALRGIRTIREFDSRYTAPHHGFRDVDDYYTRASSAPLLGRVRVPTLAIHAEDDPLLPVEPLQREHVQANPSILTLITPNGGHVGYLADPPERDPDRHWAENRLVEFFRAVDEATR